MELVFMLYFSAFLSIKLSKSYVYGHGVGGLIWVNFDFFFVAFFFQFHAQHFFIKNFSSLFFGVCLLHSHHRPITSFKG